MRELQADVAVVGAGTGGLNAHHSAKRHAGRVVLIQGGPRGTTCARVGCMPSKLLLAAADVRHEIANAQRFGLRVPEVQVDGRAVMERVRHERDRFVRNVTESTARIPEADWITGYATFLDDHTLAVSSELDSGERVATVKAERIVLATGSSPVVLPTLRFLGERVVVSDDVFEWEELPESVAVFGPGAIGLELGQALHRLGVRVHMFGVDRVVGPLTDPEVSATALEVLGQELVFDADAKLLDQRRTERGIELEFVGSDGRTHTERFELVLAATGRRPNLAGLGLGATSLELDSEGVPVFDRHTLRCGSSHVFIAGDVTGDRAVLHEAADEGRIAGTNAGRFPDVRPEIRRAPLGIVFSDPQIMVVGEGFAGLQAQRAGSPCMAIGSASFADQGRSRVMLRNQGLLRVYADPETSGFLGAEMLGPRAEHLAHLLGWSLQQGLTVPEMLELPFYHPVVEEGLRTALRHLERELGVPASVRDRCDEARPGD